ncbi:hypothetical protein G7054_g11554 [Neopestalotiopsis clavispora]|nr:hypothetical protein G7054_g11554 [Neopestalotiopsis clavispora]
MFAVTVAADDGDDFANNLFSDLAPLLALFGERVTMQFMSQSLGWADNIILAMVPLGIITIITSAIRVGGPSFLKALIGRARENLAVAEQELMSSTSKEVCELWNGHEVVRCLGSCPVTEFICLMPESELNDVVDVKVKDFGEILGGQLVQNETNSKTSNVGSSEVEENGLKPNEPSSSTIIVTRNPHMDAPNISLNSHNRMSRFELRVVAVLATILQFAVLVFSACAVYYPALKFAKDGNPVPSYAFPCNIAGTLLLVTGMLLCAHVVESSTSEEVFRPRGHVTAQLVWLQQTKTVNDQMFDSFAIYAKGQRSVITTSRRRGNDKTKQDESHRPSVKGPDPLTNQQSVSTPTSATDDIHSPQARRQSVNSRTMSREGEVKTILELKTTVGTIIGLCGFIVQFVGLRGLHWSASIAQLGAVLLMAGFKAWVRRGLAEPPRCQHVLPDFELDWFATTFADAKNSPWRPGGDNKETETWTLEPLEATKTKLSDKSQTSERQHSAANRVVRIRRDLAQLASWHGPGSLEAIAIARSIEATMDSFFPIKKKSAVNLNYTWALKTPTQGQVHFRLRRENGKWQAYADEIEAALSLWLFSVTKDENDDGKDRPDKQPIGDAQDDKWLRAKGVTARNSLRILGSHSPSLHRDLSWWIPHETTRIISLTKTEGTTNPTQTLSVRNHRIVGPEESSRRSGESTKFKVQELVELRFDSDDHQKTKNCDSKDGQDGNGNSSAAQRKDDCDQNLLAVEFIGPLRSLLAQDIFSSFFMAAAKSLEDSPFTEPAEIQHNGTSSSQAWQSFTLRSDQLMKLARTIQSTGLGSLDDIYLSMIPSLSVENKLPQVIRVIDLTRQHAEPHEKLQRWEEASDAYLWLLRVAKTFPEDSEVITQAIAILVELLRQINSALNMCERLKDERRETLRQLEGRIESELRNGGKIEETFDRLLELYTAQQRPWNNKENNNKELKYEFPGTFNFTSLHKISLTKSARVIYRVLNKNKNMTDLNTKDILGWTPLYYMARRGIEIDFALSTVKSELAVNSQDLLGHTPLHYACDTKHDQYRQSNIQALLQLGAEINAQGRDGVAPIHCAGRSGDLEATKSLVKSGANIDIQDASGKTPLLWSVMGGNQATVEYLWENANRKLRDGEGRTALHLAVVFADDETVAWLLEHGADARAVDRRTRTPLHESAQRGRLRAMQLLYQKDKAGVNAKDGYDQTTLHLAARAGHKAVAEWLIKKGADIHAADFLDQTLLHIAAKAGYRAVTRWLIQAGANVNARDGGDLTPLHLAAENGHEAVVKWLIQAEADANAKDSLGRTPLHGAATNGDKAIVEWLIQAGANVNARDVLGRTPLHWAAKNGDEAVVEWLVKKAEADVNAKDNRNRTPLHWAANNDHKAVVEWLIQAGADVNKKDNEGRTPSDLAAQSGYKAIKMWLNEKEARAAMEDRESV